MYSAFGGGDEVQEQHIEGQWCDVWFGECEEGVVDAEFLESAGSGTGEVEFVGGW